MSPNSVDGTAPALGTALAVPGPTRTGSLLAILFAANFLSFFDRSVAAAVLEPIRIEFSLNDAQLGLLGAAFTIVYAIVSIPMGVLVDRANRIRLLAGSVTVWSLFTAASGAATSFATFFAARVGVGIGEASCTPAGTSMIGDIVAPDRRARALGLFMLGFPIGSFAALAFGARIAEAYGWRAAFFAAAVPGILLAIFMLFFKDPPRQTAVQGGEVRRGGYGAVLRSMPFWSLTFASIALGMSAYALGHYLPAFFGRTHGLGLARSGEAASIVMGASGLVGLTAGAWLADRVSRGRPHGRALLGMVGCLAAAPLMLWGFATTNTAWAVSILLVGWMLYFLYFVTAHTTLIDEFDSSLRGRAMGAFALFSNVIGGTAGSVLGGLISDRLAAAAVARGVAEEAARAEGLQQALMLLVPGGLFLAAFGYAFAAWFIWRRTNRNHQKGLTA